MPLSQTQAKDRIKDVSLSSGSTRAAYEAYCGLCLAYTFGSQWAGIRAGAGYGQSLQQLQTIVGTNRTDVRFAMNQIHSRVRKAMSKLMPRELQFQVEPASWSSDDQTAALVADARLKLQLRRTSGLRALRKKDLYRTIFGSAIIRRTISSVGDPIILRDPSGRPKENRSGKPLTLRSFDHGWACCPPYEFVRDPAAHSVEFQGEDCVGHEKPRPLWWVQKHFGKVDLEEVKGTMGQLLELQNFLRAATGYNLTTGPFDSKQSGLLFGEWWFRDDEADKQRRWPWYMVTARDPAGDEQKNREFQVLHFGPSPFYGLPLHHFWYYDKAVAPWGIGIPAVSIQTQDAVNLAWNSAIRQLIRFSGPKVLIEQGSLVDSPRLAMSNRIDVPVLYKRGTKPPEYMNSPALDGNITNILQSMPQWLDQLLNMSPVQRGEAVRRGEAAKAYQVRAEMADTDFNAISDTDEITVNELLTGTLFDVVRTDDARTVINELSHQFDLDQIQTLLNQDVEQNISSVAVTADSLRPKTPSEIRDAFRDAVSDKLLDPSAARRSLLVQGKFALDVKEGRALRKQTLEIAKILGGETVDVMHAQDHDMHQWRLDMEFEQPRWEGYSKEQRQGLIEHWELHEKARLELTILRQQMQQAQEPPPQAPPEDMAGPAQEIPPQGQIIPFPGSPGAPGQPGGQIGPAPTPPAGAAGLPMPSEPALAGQM